MINLALTILATLFVAAVAVVCFIFGVVAFVAVLMVADAPVKGTRFEGAGVVSVICAVSWVVMGWLK